MISAFFGKLENPIGMKRWVLSGFFSEIRLKVLFSEIDPTRLRI